MKYLFIFVFLLSAVGVQAQKPSCCEGPKTECKAAANTQEEEDPNQAIVAFASFASDNQFKNMHPDPKPLARRQGSGKMIEFEAELGAEGRAYYVEGDAKSKNYLFVIHEWWGLNDHIKAEADRLHEELGGKVHVMALDLYDGEVATTRDGASKLMQGVDSDRARAIIDGAIQEAGSGARVATIGWCFGGGWSMQTTLQLGEQAAGCVIYYGMPEEDVERLLNLDAKVLGIFASQDKWINEEVVMNFKQNMETAGKELTYKIFEAAHAFANPSRDIYNEEAANEANSMALEFLMESFE